jgi:CheY-like chemotaxis protein
MAARFAAIEGVQIVGVAEEPGPALDGIGSTGADVVVMDLHLTGGTGMELLRGLAQSRSPVITIVLTNHSGNGFRQACLANGAQYFFDKTSEFDLACNTSPSSGSTSCLKLSTIPKPGPSCKPLCPRRKPLAQRRPYRSAPAPIARVARCIPSACRKV